MTGWVQMPGDIGQTDGQWLSIHAAIELFVTVRGNQQDAHNPLLEIPFGDDMPESVFARLLVSMVAEFFADGKIILDSSTNRV